MKIKNMAVLLTAVSLALTGCSGFGRKDNIGLNPAEGTETPVKDQVVSTSFEDQGVIIDYTTFGNLKKIKVYGVAPSWKGNVRILAEADAMDKLVKFVHGQSVSSQRRNRVIAKSIDNATDNTLNRFKNIDGGNRFSANELIPPETDFIAPGEADPGLNDSRDNTSQRIASRVENTLVNAITTIDASGRLVGVHKTGEYTKDDGKTFIAVYEWSEDTQDISNLVRSRMMQ